MVCCPSAARAWGRVTCVRPVTVLRRYAGPRTDIHTLSLIFILVRDVRNTVTAVLKMPPHLRISVLRPLSRVTAGRNTQAKRCPRGPRRGPPFKRSWGNARVWAAPLRGPLPHPTPRRWWRACHAHPWPAPSSLTRASPIAAHDPGTPPHERRRTSLVKGASRKPSQTSGVGAACREAP